MPASTAPEELAQVAIKRIRLDDKNARDEVQSKEAQARYRELLESVKRVGVLQPIKLYAIDGSDELGIVFGHMRLRAAKEAGLKTVPAIVLEDQPTDPELQEMRWDENSKRIDLNPIEKALAVEQRVDAFAGDVKKAAAAMGWTEKAVRDQLYLKRLSPKVRKLVIDGLVNAGQARELVKASPAVQESLAQGIARDKQQGIDTAIDDLRMDVESYQQPLDQAGWLLTEAFAGKPKCSDCPHNTANDKDLFGTVKGEARCTNEPCYDAKKRVTGAAVLKVADKLKDQIKKKEIDRASAVSLPVIRELTPAFIEPATLQTTIKAILPAPAAKPAAGKPSVKKEPAKQENPELKRRREALMKWVGAYRDWRSKVSDRIEAAFSRSPDFLLAALPLEATDELARADESFSLPYSDYDLASNHPKMIAPPEEKPITPALARLLDCVGQKTHESLREIAAAACLAKGHNTQLRHLCGGPEYVARVARAFGVEAKAPPVFEDFLPADLKPKQAPAKSDAR